MLSEILTASAFREVAALLALAAAAGFVGLVLRQPLIVSFIGVGLLAGPSGLDIVRSNAEIDLLSQLGIAILLFLVGIKLDTRLIRSLGVVAATTGMGQVVFTSIIGFLLALALGFDAVTGLYVAIALTFSSTIIIVKLLSDKREIDSLHGQVALGFLIVQDLFVVFCMIVVSAVSIGGTSAGGAADAGFVVLSGAALVAGVLAFVRFGATPLTGRLAQSPELLICFAIAIAALFAALGDAVGLGKEIGGLLAGVALASTPYRDAIASRLAPLRDFLLLFFFVALGAKLDLQNLQANAGAAAAFSAFILIGNPLIVLAIMGGLGFRKRTSFLAGLTVAQISEFSLIFVGMGVSLGHVTPDALALTTLVGLITIAASTYMISYSHALYAVFEPFLWVFERPGTPREPQGAVMEPRAAYDALVFGLGRYGGAIARGLRARGLQVLGVDFNPAAVAKARRFGIDAMYGDATDPEFVATLPLSGTQWAVMTMPLHERGVTHEDARVAALHGLKESRFAGKSAVVAYRRDDAAQITAAGADLVLMPFEDAAERAIELLEAHRRRTADDDYAIDESQKAL